MENHHKTHFLKVSILFSLLFFISFSGKTQLSEWFKIYADEEGTPARFDHISFNLFYNSWHHSFPEINTKPYSIGFEIGIFKEIPISKSGRISYAYGLNYSLNVVHNNANISYVNKNGIDSYTKITQETEDYSVNKFNTSFLEIPIEFRFRKIKNRKLRFYPGFKIGVLVNMYSTRINADTKYKIYRQKNRLFYRYGPTLKLGIGKINLFGFYSLSPLFEKGKGDEIHPFSIGMAFFWL